MIDLRRVAGAFFLLALLFGLLLVYRASATEVPFATKHTVDGDFDEAADVHTADIDGDGDLDIVGTALYADDVAWWENTAGDGSAWTKRIVDGNFDGALRVVAADVDSDGDMDILGTAWYAHDIAWWANNGDGTSWTKYTLNANFTHAYEVHAADVDADGDMDVLGAASGQQNVTWWENINGVGTSWTERTIDGNFSRAASVVAADMDGDGDMDAVGASYGLDDISWWENTNRAGTSWTEHLVEGNFERPYSVVAADVDGDGDMDVLGAATGANEITWWENTNGLGTTWSEHLVDGAFGSAYDVQAADLDSDGDLDVLGAATGADDITWWENSTGDGTTWVEHVVDGAFDHARAVYAGDVDGDGDLDLLGAIRSDDEIAWWENETIFHETIHPTAHDVAVNFDVTSALVAGDVDGDSDLDLLGADYLTDEIIWLENKLGSWSQHTVIGAFNGAHSVYPADINGDGALDVVGAAQLADDITWWEGDGTPADGGWTEHAVASSFDGASLVIAADLNGDGDLDILAAADEDDDLKWWENTAGEGSSWTEGTLDGAFAGAKSLYAADLDGDGDLDVLGASSSADQIAWWKNTGGDGSSWSKQLVSASFDGAYAAIPADVDADGDLDIVGAARDADTITWWENVNSGTTWTPHTVSTTFDGATWVDAADIDRDGDLDLLAAAYDDDEITWWENTLADGSTWVRHTLETSFDGARWVMAHDVNRDGKMDVLAAAALSDEISWWQNRGGQFSLITTDTAPAAIPPGSQDDVFKIVAQHNGRPGDQDMELTSLSLLLEEAAGDPLSSSEANAIIDKLHIYLDDDGSGAFDVFNDTLVATVDTLSLTAGVQNVTFAQNDPDVHLLLGTPRTYFVVLEPTANANTQTRATARDCPYCLRVTHLSMNSTAQDRDHDIGLTQSYTESVSSRLISMSGVEPPTPTPTATQTGVPSPTPTATSTPPNEIIISEVRTSNVRDISFTVSWLTNATMAGHIRYGSDPNALNQSAYDTRGVNTADETHYVVLNSLSANTTYYFDVVSADVTDDNNGAHYMVTTAPILDLPTSDLIFGQVKKADGATPAEGTLVYISLQDGDQVGSSGSAAPLSALVDDGGFWNLNLGDARIADLSSFFQYAASGDLLRLDAQGGSEGSGCLRVDTANDEPASDIVLNSSTCTTTWEITIQQGWNKLALPLEALTPYVAESACDEIDTQGGSAFEIDRWHNGTWQGHRCQLIFNNFPLVMGTGYFLRATEHSTWRIEGQEVSSPVPLTLEEGWNSISIPHTDAYTAQTLCDELINQSVGAIEIDRWYVSGWSGHICGLSFNDFQIERDQGYFIKSTSAGTVIPNQPTVFRQPDPSTSDCRPSTGSGTACRGTGTEITTTSPDPSTLRQAQGTPSSGTEIPSGKALPARNLRLSNLRDTSLTLSWTTDEPTTGYVQFGEGNRQEGNRQEGNREGLPLQEDNRGGGNRQEGNRQEGNRQEGNRQEGNRQEGNREGLPLQVAYDTRGATISSRTHYVVLDNLTPQTDYQIEIISGGEVDQTITLTTAPILERIPQPDTIYGQAFYADGVTPATGTIVYLTLQNEPTPERGIEGRQALLSAIVDADGYWQANLGNARVANGSQAFTYSADDRLTLVAQAPNGESVTQTLDVDTLQPAPPLTLSQPTRLYLPLITRQEAK
ncbi:MAG: FG-GAP-like repeat-containing protein [Ardenticatenaceae bacterium]